MSWKRFEIILSCVSVCAFVAAIGYLGYTRMQPQPTPNSDRQLFDLFLSSEINQEGEDDSKIIQPNDLSDYLVPSSTNTNTIHEPLPDLQLDSLEIKSASRGVFR